MGRRVSALVGVTLLSVAVSAVVVGDPTPATERPVQRLAAPTQPSPALSPADVVRIQVDALERNDIPHKDAGIEIAFRFASPANRSVNGPLARFVERMHSPVYSAMINHRGAVYGEMELGEYTAVQSVTFTTPGAARIAYLFSLSKQLTGRYASCWMTDALLRVQIDTDGRHRCPQAACAGSVSARPGLPAPAERDG